MGCQDVRAQLGEVPRSGRLIDIIAGHMAAESLDTALSREMAPRIVKTSTGDQGVFRISYITQLALSAYPSDMAAGADNDLQGGCHITRAQSHQVPINANVV